MDVMEKLVELLAKAIGNAVTSTSEDKDVLSLDDMASCLIANGVTVQEEANLYWKLVEPGKWNLTCSACDSHLGCREDANFCPECGARFISPKAEVIT